MKSARQLSVCILALVLALGPLLFRPGIAHAGDPPGAFNKINPPYAGTNQGSVATLNWGFSVGATSYEYCTSVTSSCGSWSGNGSVPFIQTGGLLPNSTYYWHV